MYKIQVTRAILALSSILFLSFGIDAQERDSLPRSSYLLGREIPNDIKPLSAEVLAKLNQKQPETTQEVSNFNTNTIQEISKSRISNGPEWVTSFRQMVSGVPIAGNLTLVKSYLPVSPDYLRSIEQIIRLNLSLPIFAQTSSSTSTVTYSFTVKQNGEIADLKKESSTGSPALDNVVKNLLTSVSPLDPLSKLLTNRPDPFLKLRFSLTYRP